LGLDITISFAESQIEPNETAKPGSIIAEPFGSAINSKHP